MSYIVVDVEADGEVPYYHSIVCFGAVVVRKGLKDTFYGQTAPMSPIFKPEALAISGFAREEHITFPNPELVMQNFATWIKEVSVGKPVFISDNLAFDWQWINCGFWRALNQNPHGHSGRRISDFYAGLMNDFRKTQQWIH